MVNAGMFVVFHLAGAGIALLDGVTLTWNQPNKRYFPCGSLDAVAIYRGPVEWEGSFKRAFVSPSLMGSFNVGTNSFVGTIFPTGGTNPLVSGTILLTGGSLNNLEREQLDISEEEHKFLIYNMTFTA
jgi:hypothetical protein